MIKIVIGPNRGLKMRKCPFEIPPPFIMQATERQRLLSTAVQRCVVIGRAVVTRQDAYQRPGHEQRQDQGQQQDQLLEHNQN